MTWAAIILAVLRIIDSLMDTAKTRQWMNAGMDAEIAKTSASILSKTKTGKEVMEKVYGLNEKQTDDLLRRLESPGVPDNF